MTPVEKELAEMKMQIGKIKYQIEDLMKAVQGFTEKMNDLRTQRDTSESPRPQRSTIKHASSGSRF